MDVLEQNWHRNSFIKKILIFTIIAVSLASVTVTSISAQSQYDIPSWFKGVAGFWADGNISDDEFGEGLSFLIDNDVIKVPKIQELQNEISQLRAENSELNAKISDSISEPVQKPISEPISESEVIITAKTQFPSYTNGKLIKFSGTVNPFVEKKELTITIISPEGDRIATSKATPKPDGTFSDSLVAGGTLWKSSGDYTIELQYLDETSHITINFVGGKN